MKRNKKNSKILAVVVFLILLGLVYFGVTKYGDMPREEKSFNLKKNDSNTLTQVQEKESTSQENNVGSRDEVSNEEAVKEEEKKDQNNSEGLAKNAIMDYIEKNVNELSSSTPASGIWKVKRFWFTSANSVYVEYSSNGELKQMLIQIEGDKDSPMYTRKALFGSGESSWVLEDGEDSEFGKSRELYERTGDQWVKKN